MIPFNHRDLIQSYPSAKVLFVTTETTSCAYYPGHDRSRMVTNVIFRMGASAMLFSGTCPDAKYKLLLNERINLAASDSAYYSIFYGPDDEGINGISLSKDVVCEASHVLTKLLWKVGGRVLSFKEQAKVVWSLAVKHFPMLQKVDPGIGPAYKPTFHGSVEHFVIHSGGKKILQGIGEGLRLEPYDIEPSSATLFYYGNVSSSSTWYALSFIESMRGVKKGDRVLQVGIGSGCKAGINMWEALRPIDDVDKVWEHLAEKGSIQRVRPRGGPLGGFVKISLWVLIYLLILQLVSILIALVAKHIK
jgi:3-ketoacyl-CoA synthase